MSISSVFFKPYMPAHDDSSMSNSVRVLVVRCEEAVDVKKKKNRIFSRYSNNFKNTICQFFFYFEMSLARSRSLSAKRRPRVNSRRDGTKEKRKPSSSISPRRDAAAEIRVFFTRHELVRRVRNPHESTPFVPNSITG